MHVDEKKIKSDNLLNSVKVVLVGTTHPGNIGATARAMKNMGILDLALVEPKEFPSDVATFRPKAEKDILEKASVRKMRRKGSITILACFPQNNLKSRLRWSQQSLITYSRMVMPVTISDNLDLNVLADFSKLVE